MQAEGDVDHSLLCEALQIGNPGTFEVSGRGRVSYMDPADGLFGVQEVHGRGLFGAGGQQAVDRAAAQGGGLDVLGVGDQQDRQTVDWNCSMDTTNGEQEERKKNVPTESVKQLSADSYRSWPCTSGCLAATGSPPHRSRCSRLQCWYRTDCRSRTNCTHRNLNHRQNRRSYCSGQEIGKNRKYNTDSKEVGTLWFFSLYLLQE